MVTAAPPQVSHPADRLVDAIRQCGAPVCVGLDPVRERLPPELAGMSAPAAIEAFCLAVVEACAGTSPAVKIQSACFERHGHEGMRALAHVMQAARERGLVTILDAKRGDIGISAEHYAASAAALGTHWITVSGYMGPDTITPFLDAGLGAFVLVRTSNPGSDALQSLKLEDGRTIADAVADMVEGLGASRIGQHGRSAVGAVVGATKPSDAATLRDRMPRSILLVPGYGAQGGTLGDIRPLFGKSGHDALVTASRSVIYPDWSAAGSWHGAIARAAEAFAREIREGIPG